MNLLYEYEPNIRKRLLLDLLSKLADPDLELESLKKVALNEAIPYVWRWQDDLEGHAIKESTELTVPLRNATSNLVKLLEDIARRNSLPEVSHTPENTADEEQLPSANKQNSNRQHDEETTNGSQEPRIESSDADSNRISNSSVSGDEESDTDTLASEDEGSETTSNTEPQRIIEGHLAPRKHEGMFNDENQTIEHRFRYLSTHDAQLSEAALSILFHIADGSGGGMYKLTDAVDFSALGRVLCSLLYAVNVNVSMNAVRVLSQVVGAARYFPPLEIPQLLLAMALNIPGLNGSSSKWDGCTNPMDPYTLFLIGEKHFFQVPEGDHAGHEDSEFANLEDPVEFAAKSIGKNAPYYVGKLRLKRAAKDLDQIAVLVSQQIYSLAALMILLSPYGFEAVVNTRAPDALQSLLEICRTQHNSSPINYVKACIIEGVTIILSFWSNVHDSHVFKRWQLTPILRDLYLPGLNHAYLYQLCDLASFAPLKILIPMMPRLVEMSVDSSLPAEGRLRALDVLARILMAEEFTDENVSPDKMLETLFYGLQGDISILKNHRSELKSQISTRAKLKAKSKKISKHHLENSLVHFDAINLYRLVTERLEVLGLWISHLTWADLDRTLLNTTFIDQLIQILNDVGFRESLPSRALASTTMMLAKICQSEQARVLLLSEQGLDLKLYDSIISLAQAHNRRLELFNIIATLYRCLWGNPQNLEDDLDLSDENSIVRANVLTKEDERRMYHATEFILDAFGLNLKDMLQSYTRRAAKNCMSGIMAILFIFRARKFSYQSWLENLAILYLEISNDMDSDACLTFSDFIEPLVGTYEDVVELNKLVNGLLVKFAIKSPNLNTAKRIQNTDSQPMANMLDDVLRDSVELLLDNQPLQFMRLLKYGEFVHKKHHLWFTEVVPEYLATDFIIGALIYAANNLHGSDLQSFENFGYLQLALGSSTMIKLAKEVLELSSEVLIISEASLSISPKTMKITNGEIFLSIVESLLQHSPNDEGLAHFSFGITLAMMSKAIERDCPLPIILGVTKIFNLVSNESLIAKNYEEMAALKHLVLQKFGLDAFYIPEFHVFTFSSDVHAYLVSQIQLDELDGSIEAHSDGVSSAINGLPQDTYVKYHELFSGLLRHAVNRAVSLSSENDLELIKDDSMSIWSKYNNRCKWLLLANALIIRMSSFPESGLSKEVVDLIQEIIRILVTKIVERKLFDSLSFTILHTAILNAVKCTKSSSQTKEIKLTNNTLSSVISETLSYELQANFVFASRHALKSFMRLTSIASSATENSRAEQGIVGLSFINSVLIQNDMRLSTVAIESGLIQELMDSALHSTSGVKQAIAETLVSLCHVIITSPAVMAGLLIEHLNSRDQFYRSSLNDGHNGDVKSPAEAIIQRRPELIPIVKSLYVRSAKGRLTQWHLVEKAAKKLGITVSTPISLEISQYESLPKRTMNLLISQLTKAFLDPMYFQVANILSDTLCDLIITTGSTRETLLSQFPGFIEDSIIHHGIKQNGHLSHHIQVSTGDEMHSLSLLIGSLSRKSKDEPFSAQTLKSLVRSTKHILHAVLRVLDQEVPRRKQRNPEQALSMLHTCCDIISFIWGNGETAWENLTFISETASVDSLNEQLFNQSLIRDLGVVESVIRALSLFDFSAQDIDGLRTCALNFILQIVKQDTFKVVHSGSFDKCDGVIHDGQTKRETTTISSEAFNTEANGIVEGNEDDNEILEADLATERRREHQQRMVNLRGNVFRNSSLGEYESSTSESEMDPMEVDEHDSEDIIDDDMSIDGYESISSIEDDNDSDISSVSSDSHQQRRYTPDLEITLVLSADEDEDDFNTENSDDSIHSTLDQNVLDSYLDRIEMSYSESSDIDEGQSSPEAQYSEESDGTGDISHLPLGLEIGDEVLLLYGDGHHYDHSEDAEEIYGDIIPDANAQTRRSLSYFKNVFVQNAAKSGRDSSGYRYISPIDENSELVSDWNLVTFNDNFFNQSTLEHEVDSGVTNIHGSLKTINVLRQWLDTPQAFSEWRFTLKTETDSRLAFLPQVVAMLARIMFADIFENDRFLLHEIFSWLSLNPMGSHAVSTLINILFDASRGHIDSVYASLTRNAASSKSAALSTAVPQSTTPALVCSNLFLVLSEFFGLENSDGSSLQDSLYQDIVNFAYGTNNNKFRAKLEEKNILQSSVQMIARNIISHHGSSLIGLFTKPLIHEFREQQIVASDMVSHIFRHANTENDSTYGNGNESFSDHNSDGQNIEPEQNKDQNSNEQNSDGSVIAHEPLDNKENKSDNKGRIQIKLDAVSLQQVVDVLGSKQCNSRVFYNIADVVKKHISSDLLILPVAEAIKSTKSQLINNMTSIARDYQSAAGQFNAALILDVLARDQLRLLRLFTLIGELFSQYKCLVILQRMGLLSLWSKILEFVKMLRRKQTLGPAYLMALLDIIALPADIIVREYTSVSKDNKDRNDYNDEDGTISGFVDEVSKFLESELPRCQDLVNEQLKQKPRLMNGPLGTIARKYKIMDFENKQAWLEQQLENAKDTNEEEGQEEMNFVFNRNDVFQSAFELFSSLKGEQLRSPLLVSFENEPGIDEGGVGREFLEILSREIVNPMYALFTPTVKGSSVYQVNPLLEENDEKAQSFRFVGRVIGRAVFERRVIGLHFSRVIYKYILHQSISLSDMEAVDQEYYKSLKWMLENDITDVFFETFSYEVDMFGVITTIDLIPNGRDISVNESNKHEYVKRVVEYKLVESVEASLKALEDGIFDVLDREWIEDFNEQELELLISGLPTIDVDDWMKNTVYEGYNESSPQIVWFWLAVKSFSAEQKAKLLQFSTGTSRVPARGFGHLESNTDSGKFFIQKEKGSTSRLPSSHTCMNQISLPEYESYKKLRTLLLKAITEGSEGFAFA